MSGAVPCQIGSCQRHGRCMYLNHPRGCGGRVEGVRRMTPSDYAELGIPVPEHMTGGRAITIDVREFYEGFRLQDAAPLNRCEACGEDDEAYPFCEGCGCCYSCCNCTSTDCDCSTCEDRRGSD